MTENNVNADYDKGGGISACNGTEFVLDQRGSSAFFAAWRPYVFSQFGKAGAQALYHWDFDADAELHEPIGGELTVTLCHQRLDGDSALDRAHDTRKLKQETVAGVLHEPAAMIENDRVYRASMGFERGVRTFLVGAHHARITGDVSADDGC